MKKYLLAASALVALCPQAEAIPVPGFNTVEDHCLSYYDYAADPIKQPGVKPSAHSHTHYGLAVDEKFNVRPLADFAQRVDDAIPFRQNYPGGGQSTIRDEGYDPQIHSCNSYGNWSWSAIPTPMVNGQTYDWNRSWTWTDPVTYPRVVSVMTETWAGPVGQHVIEQPFGYTFIVGNSGATNESQQDNDHVWWTCGDLVTKSRAPRDCSGAVAQPPHDMMMPAPQLMALFAAYTVAFNDVNAQAQVLNAAINAGMTSVILTAVNGLQSKVVALQTAVAAIQAAASAPPPPPPPPSGQVASEWEHHNVVTGVIQHPDCWDGQAAYPNFDHQMGIDRRHFFYSTNGSCGTGIKMVQLYQSFHFWDPTTGKVMTNPFNADGSMKLTFASGPYYTFHADYARIRDIGVGWFTAGCINKETHYGGFHQLNRFFSSCNIGNAEMSRCPAANPPDWVAAGFGPRGAFICKDQD